MLASYRQADAVGRPHIQGVGLAAVVVAEAEDEQMQQVQW